jgi:hypothetical protein
MMAIEVYNGVIVERVIGGVNDKRLVLAGGHWARKMSIGDNWSELRIAMRIASRMATPALIQYTYFGLCNNTDAPPASMSPRHFYGWRVGNAVPFFDNPVRMTWGDATAAASAVSHIEGGSESISTNNLVYRCITRDAAGAGATLDGTFIGLTITKGTPWSVTLWGPISNQTFLRCTMDEFISAMVSPTVPSGMDAVSTVTQFTPDEGTYGALDSICFVNTDPVFAFEISDIAYTRLA